MKRDKKDMDQIPAQKNTVPENPNEEENKNVEKCKKEATDKNKNKGTKQTKSKNKTSKKKKVILDYPPTLNNIEPIELQDEKPPDFNYLSPKENNENVEIKEELRPRKEWVENLISWFSHLRPSFFQFSINDSNKEITLQSIIKQIEAGKMPTTHYACNVQEIDEIIFYFERKNKDKFTKSDLAWLFSALIFTDRLLSDDIASSLEKIATTVIHQINSINSVNDSLYPYLIVISSLLQKFFHLQ